MAPYFTSSENSPADLVVVTKTSKVSGILEQEDKLGASPENIYVDQRNDVIDYYTESARSNVKERRKCSSPTNERKISGLFDDVQDSSPTINTRLRFNANAINDGEPHPHLSLMASSDLDDLEDVTITPRSVGLLELQADMICSQIDADKALAIQLQKEEDSKKIASKGKSKPRLVGYDIFSVFGEPTPMEMLGMPRVNSTDSGNGSESGDVFSELTSTFRRWGGVVSSAANDLFKEERPVSRFSKSNNSS